MPSKAKGYLVPVCARITDLDYAKMKKRIKDTDETIADCIRMCIHNTLEAIQLDESDERTLDSIRCHVHESTKHYSRKR